MRSPSDCQTMTELRTEIDRLDKALVALLVERAAFIDRAAQLKPVEGLPARIGPRVAEVLSNVERLAQEGGLDPALARALWTQIIEWSIAREERVMGPDTERSDP
ncbi:MAG: chorismate mutase [Roseinatronobacter sp.]